MKNLDINANNRQLTRAYYIFWFAFWLSIITVIGGRIWDASWHSTHLFDGFFSPPHIFMYALTLLTITLLEIVVFSASLRGWFGEAFSIGILPFKVPGTLALVGSGYFFVALGGLVLDNLWHTQFGLSETIWSFPHAMLTWAWLLIMLGFLSCGLALHIHRPFSDYTLLIMSFFVVGFSVIPILGPYYQYPTPAMVQAVSNIPVLSAQPDAQRGYQVYLHWNLTRTNPLLVPLGAFWVGTILSFLQQLDKRPQIWLSAVFFWTLVTALGDYGSTLRLNLPVTEVASWLPLPIFPIGCLLALFFAFRLPQRWAWVLSGFSFGILVLLFWGKQPVTAALIPIAGLTALLGAWSGEQVYKVVKNPTRTRILPLLLGCLSICLLVGVLDLVFRFAII